MDYKYISKYFEYDYESGAIYHKEIGQEDLPDGYKHSVEAWNSRKAGKRADYLNDMKRYVNRIVYAYDSEKIVKYLAHHIAWLLYHKEWPGSNLDHINGDATDNRIENLRKADGVVNNRNKKPDPFRKKPRGVRFYLSGKSKTPTFCAWYRDDNGKDVVLYRGRDYFEAICVRKSWENDTLMDGTSGYTERHFGR